MSDNAEEPRPEQGNVNPTQRAADDIDWSQFYDMFMTIEQQLPNFDHMLMAMNDYAFKRTSRQRQTNDLSEFCEVLKKGFFDWYTNSINNEIKRVPNFIDLTNQVYDILMNFDKKQVSTSLNTDTSKVTDTSANADAIKNTRTSGIADTSKNTSTSPNTDACKSIQTNPISDVNESTNISANTDTSESTNTSDNTDASVSANTSANADVGESTNTNTNTDASESTSTQISAITSSPASATTCTNKRPKPSYPQLASIPNTIHYYRHDESKSLLATLEAFETLSQSTEQSAGQSTDTNAVSDYSFKIIMPSMTEDNTYLRKMLPIDHYIHLGNDYERHWWRQTNEKITLNVDISDLVVDLVPNIEVMVTIIGFMIKIKHENKWIILLSNKFEKSISNSKWAINEHMHVKITLTKRVKEFWTKCLVTETKEISPSIFKNHSCTNECNMLVKRELNPNPSKEECLKTLSIFLKKGYGMKNDSIIEDSDHSTVTDPLETEENSQDSATTLMLSVDPSTVPTFMESEDLQNFAESCNGEVSQNQLDTSADNKSVKSSSDP